MDLLDDPAPAALVVVGDEDQPDNLVLPRGTLPPTGSDAWHDAIHADLAVLVAWCHTRGIRCRFPLPVATLVSFVEDVAEGRCPAVHVRDDDSLDIGHPRARKRSTLDRYLVTVRHVYRVAWRAGEDWPDPFVDETLRDTIDRARQHLGAAQRQAAPLLLDQLRAVSRMLPVSTHGLRDRAVLVVGWASACRASELCALDVADLRWDEHGVVLHLRRSKTDQAGVGRDVRVPYGSAPNTCPVRSLQAWLYACHGEPPWPPAVPVFRHVSGNDAVGVRLDVKTVSRIVQSAAKRLGFEPSRYSSHSLRAGLVTEALRQGRSDAVVMAQTGHRSVAMLARYHRLADLSTGECAAAGLGL